METIGLILDNLNLVVYPFHSACVYWKPAIVNNGIGISFKGSGKGYNRSKFTLLCQMAPAIKKFLRHLAYLYYQAPPFSQRDITEHCGIRLSL